MHSLSTTTVAVFLAGIMVGLPVFGAEPDENSLYKNMPPEVQGLKNPYQHGDVVAVERGRDLFNKLCVGCHGRSGDGRGPIAGYTRVKPTDFTRTEYVSRITDQQLYWVIKNGHSDTKMPAYGLLEEERWSLVVYIRLFSEGRGPEQPVRR